ncbi:MAG: hypothetical protein AB8A42_05450, partial [Prochlorococcus sp.]
MDLFPCPSRRSILWNLGLRRFGSLKQVSAASFLSESFRKPIFFDPTIHRAQQLDGCSVGIWINAICHFDPATSTAKAAT